MHYTLRDYQRKAARDVLRNIQRGLRDHNEYADTHSAFALSALTGAGKTVIAGAVIEAILRGSADLEGEPNPKAAFLWVTDDPALNRQSSDRILVATSEIAKGQLVEIDETFDERVLAPGAAYFLNVQKLGKATQWSRSGTDSRQYSIWDTVANTIRTKHADLILVLDEAHKGMRPQKDRKTLVRQLIDGPPQVPVVWGISATVDRFEEAMGKVQGRDKYDPVTIDNELIRSSGLVKDKIVLDNPDEKGPFDATLLRDAVDEVREMEERWRTYTQANELPEVVPVLVVQVKDKVTESDLADTISIITTAWGSDLRESAIVHVFGEHAHLEIAGRTVRYKAPDRIQGDKRIRVVLAKEAISTGWDCPRAEVLYSERGAKDDTRIAQIIGRIVRTPLAMRVLGDERLSQVSCYLPDFDRDAVDRVIERLRTGDDAVAIDPVRRTQDYLRLAELDQAGVFELLDTLPCEPTPQKLADPVRRAKTLATHLAGDGIVPDAGAQLTARLNARLDGLAAEHAGEVKKNVEDLFTADLERTVIDYAGDRKATRTAARSRTDARNVDDAYRVLERRIKEGVVRDWRKHVVNRSDADTDLIDTKAEVAALLMVDGAPEKVVDTADEWAKTMLSAHRVAIRGLSTDRQADYLAVQAQTRTPERVDLMMPDVRTEPIERVIRDSDGTVKLEPIAQHAGHLYADENGNFPAILNGPETQVLKVESARADFVAWYRNPSTAKDSSLRIAYLDGEETWKSLQPDFIIVSRRSDGTLAASIVDPHGDYLADALSKLRALADYVETYAGELHRVESLNEIDGELRLLDLTDEETRAAVRAHEGPKVTELYSGPHSRRYE